LRGLLGYNRARFDFANEIATSAVAYDGNGVRPQSVSIAWTDEEKTNET
jgi:hypothetical protein